MPQYVKCTYCERLIPEQDIRSLVNMEIICYICDSDNPAERPDEEEYIDNFLELYYNEEDI